MENVLFSLYKTCYPGIGSDLPAQCEAAVCADSGDEIRFCDGRGGYTYTAIVPMYARAGYSICMRYFMGVKKV